MFGRNNGRHELVALSWLTFLTVSFAPAAADEPTAPVTEATSGWPSLPPPSMGEVENLIKIESGKMEGAGEQANLDCQPSIQINDKPPGSESSSRSGEGLDRAPGASESAGQGSEQSTSALSDSDQIQLNNTINRRAHIFESTSNVLKRPSQTESP